MATRLHAQRSRKVERQMPSWIEPMLATPGLLPANQQHYTFEYKWDGVRALGFFDRQSHRLFARSGNNITHRYPELKHLADALSPHQVVLDGEIVSLDESGRPSFGRLQSRIHTNDAKAIVSLSKSEPVFYVVFDIVYQDGRSLLEEPYSNRREILEQLTLMGDNWQVTPAHAGEGLAMLANAQQSGLEGIVAKEITSNYQPGRRSTDWIKIKIIQRQEFVVAGWLPERSGLESRIGSILVGYYDCHHQLHFAGKVGTGFSANDHVPLITSIAVGKTRVSPFVEPIPRGAIFTKKPLVAEIEYRRWPTGGLLQQAAFKGLRNDKPASLVVREFSQ